jgi:hypothetical protein
MHATAPAAFRGRVSGLAGLRLLRRLGAAGLLLAMLLAAALPLAAAAGAQEITLDADQGLTTEGRFFAVPGGDNAGFIVSNADGIPFLSSFYSLGGPDAVGIPVTHRFVRDGRTTQAFQRLVLHWRPAVGVVYEPRTGSAAGPYPVAAVQPLPARSAPVSAIDGALSWGPLAPLDHPASAPARACEPDALMAFNPPRPTAGQTVSVSVTSARKMSDVSLRGAFSPVLTVAQFGGHGYLWTWSIRVDGPGQYTYDFLAEGRVCTSQVLTVRGEPLRSPLPY